MGNKAIALIDELMYKYTKADAFRTMLFLLGYIAQTISDESVEATYEWMVNEGMKQVGSA